MVLQLHELTFKNNEFRAVIHNFLEEELEEGLKEDLEEDLDKALELKLK